MRVETVVRLQISEVSLTGRTGHYRVDPTKVEDCLAGGGETIGAADGQYLSQEIRPKAERIKRDSSGRRVLELGTEPGCAITKQVVPARRGLVLRRYSY